MVRKFVPFGRSCLVMRILSVVSVLAREIGRGTAQKGDECNFGALIILQKQLYWVRVHAKLLSITATTCCLKRREITMYQFDARRRINFTNKFQRTLANAPSTRFVQIHFVNAEFFGGNRAAAIIGTLPVPPIDLPLTVSRIRAPCFRVTIVLTGNLNCDLPLMRGNFSELIVCANSFDTREMVPLLIERSSELNIIFSKRSACTYSLFSILSIVFCIFENIIP